MRGKRKFSGRGGKFHPRTRFDPTKIKHGIAHRIAFLGNPNVGKSSLFNGLTGKHQHIGNWPGKTIEKKEGHFILSDEYFSLTDLPGTYSLTARSEEELIARQFVIEEKPDLVCVIVDASRLERTLFIALQAMELTSNVALVVNMMDVADKEGITIDRIKLQEQLGIPVVLVSAFDNMSYISLKKFLYDTLHTEKYHFTPAKVVYPREIELMLLSIGKQIDDRNVLMNYPTNWLAFKVLEGDEKILTELEKEFDLSNVRKKIELFKETENYIPSSVISKRKYRAIQQILSKSVSGLSEFKEKKSDKVDKIILHRFWGYPILILIYAIFFLITFYLSSPILGGMDWLVSKFANWILSLLLNVNSPAFLNSLIVNGVIAGIGAVLLFLPIIAIFYTLVAILEDSGYLARSAYLMDRVMGKFGLQGTAFLSLIMGFGCNVAGIMATRTIKNESDRKIMILANSFIPCSARLGVLAFVTGIFFKPWLAAIILLLLYGLSIFFVLITAFLASFFIKKEEKLPLILELPEYRRPRLRNISYLTWERTRIFLIKAGTMIFVASILIWLVSSIPFNVPPERTIIGYVGRGLAYVTYPLMGLDWKMIVPLAFGIGAKEVIISALGILYSSGGTIVSALLAAWTIPQVISFLIFQMTYAPCFATIATMKSESKSWKLTALGFFYPLILTTIITTIVYHLLVLVMG